MPHPDEGLIHAWLDGELDAAEAARVDALVASDPDWAAAAADARGLIAAAARITSALDRTPAAVIPAMPAPRRAGRAWIWRAAAALALVAGSAVVLERQQPEVVPPAIPAMPPETVSKKVVVKQKKKTVQSTLQQQQLSIAKAIEPEPAKDAAAGAAVPAPQAAATRAAAAPSAAARAMFEKAAVPLLCFQQREPADSARRVVTLTPAALDDSIRLEKLALRADTLVAVSGPFRAVRVRCP